MAAEAQKEPGKLKQMWRVLQMTRRGDKWIVPILLVSFLGPLALGIILPFTVLPGGIFTKILWITTGVLGGLLLALVILGNRAEAVAYRQISGQPGAVGAILQGSLRRAWQTSEFPVQVNPRTQDAVYRAVGKCGVVLIAEGPKTRVKKNPRRRKENGGTGRSASSHSHCSRRTRQRFHTPAQASKDPV